MRKGGYEEGYANTDCFWGVDPAQMVVRAINELSNHPKPLLAADFGCGEGKNAKAMCDAGFSVVAFELSEDALSHAKEHYPNERIAWVLADYTKLGSVSDVYDLAIATGSLHCLDSTKEIYESISMIQEATRAGGLNVISSFNYGPHDFAGHDDGFTPCLISHKDYLNCYEGWEVIDQSDLVQKDSHPNNNVEHTHSITRLIARKPGS